MFEKLSGKRWTARRLACALGFTTAVAAIAAISACGGGGGGGSSALNALALQQAAAAAQTTSTTTTATTTTTTQPPVTQQSIKHVFVLTMENKDFAVTFGTSTQDPYLKSLATQGALLSQYYGTGHVSLDNYIAMMSGQPSTKETESDCFQGFNDVVPTGWDFDNPKVLVTQGGKGCVYPTQVQALPNQLDTIGVTWKGYMGDMGNDPTREAATCGHPKIGAIDNTQSAEAPTADVPNGDQYATRHNPFVYFHSIIDNQGYCNQHLVNLDANLANDLKSIDTTPNFVFITPNLCDDGHDGDGTGTAGKGCVNGAAGGLTSIDAFLKKWIPIIQASPAYQKDGLIVINFDESADIIPAGQSTDATTNMTTVTLNLPGASCCGQVTGPNVTRPDDQILPAGANLQYDLHYIGVGGDLTGAVMLSKWIKPGTVSSVQYNHYSLLKSLENIFQTKEYLGYADDANLVPFGSDIFTNLQ